MLIPISVTFIRQHGSYNAGEIATFTSDQAAELFKAGIARPTATAPTAMIEPEPIPAKGVAAKKGGRRA